MTQEICPNVLVVTEDVATTRLLLEVMAGRGIRGTVVRDAKAATDQLDQHPWDMAIVDLDEPGDAGLEIVRQIKRRYPEVPVIMLSRTSQVPVVVRAMRDGCHDFLVKPVERPTVESMMDSLLPGHAVPLAAAEQADCRCLFQIAGRSPRLFETIGLAKRVAPTSLPVLITGESGTGKELISYLIHRASPRAQGPYIRINCAALSETLLESELFGHERGAFTGAHVQHKGRFERAHGGTLLLDEISETGPRLQAELLRVLEQQDFERVGGSESIAVNVRVVSTTNRDLAREVERGRFRADLFYRLGGLRISVPPLRERKEDIPILVWHFVNQFAREVRRHVAELDPEMMDLFFHYDWPGNVRQLRNLVRTALVVGDGPVLSLAGAPWLQAEILATQRRPGAVPSLRLRDLERQAILQALRLTRSHQIKAAHLLGITDRTLREKLRRYRAEGLLADAGQAPAGAAPTEQETEFTWPAEADLVGSQAPGTAGGMAPPRGRPHAVRGASGESPCLKAPA
jgi:DNA-binding NtrC family response regulator